MGKRQIRIFARDLSSKLSSVINREVNILLKNGAVFHGIIKQQTISGIHLEDMFGHKHTIETNNVDEIILDIPALY
jgi:hypothetical protein